MAQRSLASSLLASIALAGFTACNSPTEPSSGYDVLATTGTFGSADGGATILELQQLIDGEESVVGSSSSTNPPVAAVNVNVSRWGVGRHGHHTLTFRVKAQAASPVSYRASGIVVYLTTSCFSLHNGCPLVTKVQLPDRTQSVATGGSMTLEFDF
jgi:hypothetical protein